MASRQPTQVQEIENSLKKLGWVSAYSRQVLLSRHLLRSLGAIHHPDEFLVHLPASYILDVFRCVITILSGVNRETHLFSSPYEPSDRPDTHFLAYSRKERIFSASIASGMPDINFHIGDSGGLGLENSTEISVEDGLLAFEIQSVSRNISLKTKFMADRRAEELRNEKLWRGLTSDEQAVAASFFDNWYEWSGAVGAFWREWYHGFLDGKPLDWELQRRIALIDDAIWKAGPLKVAEEIDEIRAKFSLEKKVDELEIEIRDASANRFGIGGNNPPEEMVDVPIAAELLIVWQPLQELKAEVEKANPDPSKFQQIIAVLGEAMKVGLSWCLKKADLAVDTAIKWAVPAGATGFFALNPDKIEAVIEAAKHVLSFL